MNSISTNDDYDWARLLGASRTWPYYTKSATSTLALYSMGRGSKIPTGSSSGATIGTATAAAAVAAVVVTTMHRMAITILVVGCYLFDSHQLLNSSGRGAEQAMR